MGSLSFSSYGQLKNTSIFVIGAYESREAHSHKRPHELSLAGVAR